MKMDILKNLLNQGNSIPIIIIDKQQKFDIEGFDKKQIQTFDFTLIKNGDLERLVKAVSSIKESTVLFKNIDKIPESKDKEFWESIITIGLKGEEYPIRIETEDGYNKTFILPFDKIKIITTCSEYPDFLKDKGMLGYIVDFSDNDSD